MSAYEQRTATPKPSRDYLLGRIDDLERLLAKTESEHVALIARAEAAEALLSEMIRGADHARNRSTEIGMGDFDRLQVLGSVCATADKARAALSATDTGKDGDK